MNKYVYSVNNERISVDPKLLINDLKPGEDEREITWYPEPHFSFVKKESDEFIKGTFRSASCCCFLKKCAPPVLGFQIYLLSKSACY